MPSALDAIAHVVLPNLMKIKGVTVIVSAMERGDTSLFAPVWTQCGVEHKPQVLAKERGDWRLGVLSLPAPKEMGDAYMCAFVSKKADASMPKYFTLEYDYVLATKTSHTTLCEREGQRMRKIGDGPVITGDFATDGGAFIDACMLVIEPPAPIKKY